MRDESGNEVLIQRISKSISKSDVYFLKVRGVNNDFQGIFFY